MLDELCANYYSGLIFAFSYSIAYTCAIALGKKYHYNAMQIGLVLLAFGVGES